MAEVPQGLSEYGVSRHFPLENLYMEIAGD